MILLPDEQIAHVYKNDVEPHIKQGASLAFAHGFNVHYGQVMPREDLDVWMVRSQGPGPHGGAIPTRKAAGAAPDRGSRRQDRQSARSGAVVRGSQRRRQGRHHRDQLPRRDRNRSVRRQAVLCGGTVELIKAGFETLTEAGYAPEMAYFEMPARTQSSSSTLIYEGGIANMILLDLEQRGIRAST